MRLLERLRTVNPESRNQCLLTYNPPELTGKVVDKLLNDLRSGFIIEEKGEVEEGERKPVEKTIFEVSSKGQWKIL